MSYDEIFNFIKTVLIEECEVSAEALDRPTSEIDLQDQLDSMAVLTVVTEIENHYKICLDDDIENIPKTMSDLISKITELLKAQENPS